MMHVALTLSIKESDMAFDKDQFKDLIERTLKKYGLYSESAVNLLLGTAAQESRFGTYLKQLGNGPALGIFQMEPETFAWLKRVYGTKYNVAHFDPQHLETSLECAIVFARLRYRIVPTSLPAPDDIHGLAEYWKHWYNTSKGKGRQEDFIENYRRYVA